MRNLITNQTYHIFNRGASKARIFIDEKDYSRFYASLFLFNNKNYSNPLGERLFNEALLAARENPFTSHKPLVKIISFNFLPNHFHLMLEPLVENGISIFIHKVCMSHAKYFNKKRNKIGQVFGSRFKSVHIKKDAQFNHLPRYIHLNSLDLKNFKWRDGLVDNWEKALRTLNTYKWSSHGVYLGKKQLLPVVDEEAVKNIFSSPNEYLMALKDFCCGNVPFKHLYDR